MNSANETSATSFGSTQTTSPLRTRGIFGGFGKGEVFRSSGLSFFSSRSCSASSKPVPTLPTHSRPSGPFVASTSEPNDHSRRPLPFV